MDFLKAILGDALYAQVEQAIAAYNGKPENAQQQVKLANLAGGQYVSKGKYDTLDATNKTNEQKLGEAQYDLSCMEEADNLSFGKQIFLGLIKNPDVAVERKLYYCYRFISEFSGKSIDHDDVKAFRHQFYKKGSVSSRSLEGISKRIKETKVQIDNILKLLNDAAEYRSSESNIKLQWIMMIVTILSLFVALYSVKNGDVINEIKKLIEWIKTLSS